MTGEPTEKELKLAARVNELDDAAARPALGDGGLFAAAVKFLMSRVSRGMMAAALSTSSNGNGVALGTRLISPRSVTSALD